MKNTTGWAHTAFVLALNVLALTRAVPAAAAESRDAKAVEIAQTMMKAMGGEGAWAKAHFVRYDFRVTVDGKTVLDRAHLWDKSTGRYRIDSTLRDGKPTVTMFNINDQKGTVYAGGKALQGADAAKGLKDAYAAFINDMYWLAMPWKWLDAGVNLKYVGRKSLGAKSFDVVELTFGKVGLTPGDRYDAYVSPRTHLMEHWEYTLQSGTKDAWDWTYTTSDGVTLALDHYTSGHTKRINMGAVRVTANMDDHLFTDVTKSLK
jgi:hypothetical protein